MIDCADAVAVLEDRIDERQNGRRAPARDVVVRALRGCATRSCVRRGRRLVVDLFPCVLPDVADEQRARAAARGIVEAEPPGIAQTEGSRFIQRRDGRPSTNGLSAGTTIARRRCVSGTLTSMRSILPSS